MHLNNSFTTTPKAANDSSIGERIRYARKEIGLNQVALAERVGVSQPSVANWETGLHDPRRIMLIKLASVLGVSPEWLAGGTRSFIEDDHPASAYLRRRVVHTPIISLANASAFLAKPDTDPHIFAEDYIPITTQTEKVFGFFTNDPALAPAFQEDTLIIVDYADRSVSDGDFCLYATQELPILRRWRERPARLEAIADGFRPIDNPDRNRIIGRTRVSIQFH
ncbi:MAG: helix-turn-helix transcriptional regulator [Pseudomonadota bacterium]